MPLVCIDCRYMDSTTSGIAEVVSGLASHAPQIATDLDFILLRGSHYSKRLSEIGNVREVVVRQPANGPVSMWLLPTLLERAGVNLATIDLFHAPANILPAGLTMRCVTTIHDLMWLTHPQWCHRGKLGVFESAFFRHGLRRAIQRSAAVVTVSAATGAAVAQYQPGATARIFTALSGVSADFRPLRHDPQALADLGLDPERRYILVVGQNAPYKNHEGALRAFTLAFARRGEFDLVFVHRRGAGAQPLAQMAATLGIGHRVRFLEQVSREQLVGLYNMADTLLHPSLCEGFGNPLVEAMACGCPVVTSSVSAMPEVAGGAALLADPLDFAALADCLRRVTDEPGLAATLREKGLARAAALDWRSFAAANVAIYRQVLEMAPNRCSTLRAADR